MKSYFSECKYNWLLHYFNLPLSLLEISSKLGSYRDDFVDIVMKTESDYDYNYLINELESLGKRTKKLNELNDLYEIRNLVDHLKQTFIQDYKSFCDYGTNTI